MNFQKIRIIIGITIIFIISIAGFLIFSDKGKKVSSDQLTTAVILGENYHKYTHQEPKFSIEYPKELIVESFQEEDGGETIVFQGEEKLGLQIFISLFNGEGQEVLGRESVKLTQERILEDLPTAVIDDPKEVILGIRSMESEQRIQALIFWSEDPSIGRTREVWFVHKNYLYEITTYAHLDTWLANILSTLEF